MKSDKDYPASRFAITLISILFLVGIILNLLLVFYKPYYKYTVNGNFIGYYKTQEEYEECYNSIEKEKTVDGAKQEQYLTVNPISEQVLVKETYVKQFDNKALIEQQLTKDYVVYVIKMNNEQQFYTKTLEEANEIVNKIKEQIIETITITTEPTTIKDLSIIETEEKRNEIINNIIEKNKKPVITSRAGENRLNNPEYIWPTISKTITSKFGNRRRGYHTGLDIGVASNSPVYAMKSGTVILACWNNGYGYQVKVQHSNGVITTYAHNSKLLVSKGEQVAQGQIIARSGSTGNSTGPHVHVEFIINGNFVNPQNYI